MSNKRLSPKNHSSGRITSDELTWFFVWWNFVWIRNIQIDHLWFWKKNTYFRGPILQKLDYFTLEMSKNHLIRNFLRNGRLRVNFKLHFFELRMSENFVKIQINFLVYF